MNEYVHTFELQDVNEACAVLISQNAEHLINFIYQSTDQVPYNNTRTRVGLVLKTLMRGPDNGTVLISSDIIEPVTHDLEELIEASSTDRAQNIPG
jgi:hypothetical protein